ncbi:Thiopurine S-methyltransferase-like 1 [Homarus americanus]|uniref:Thiopurine S-methyltransferase-like 1 n=1 Tax=Homarus americanus TaxID=6706 RepID=A0A8J5JRE7_HOMAM|nr:Thiopurine S-methyltransferase-like 1 [Homarus americanus]
MADHQEGLTNVDACESMDDSLMQKKEWHLGDWVEMLYERGNTVVGLEGVEKPVREFYEMYPDLQHSVEDLPFGKLFKSSDGRLQVYVCDVTQVPSEALGKFDAVFDWGAYTAIVEGDRQRYVDVVMATMKEDSRYFLEVCHDGPPEATGIPNSVSFRTLKLEFGPSWRLRVLETLDISEDWEVESFFNSYFLITPKNSQ